MCRRWSRDIWIARSDRTPPMLRLAELAALKLSLSVGTRLCCAPFELDVWIARNSRIARYITILLEMESIIGGNSRCGAAGVTPAAIMDGREGGGGGGLPMNYWFVKKDGVLFWSNLVCFKLWARFVVVMCQRLHDEVSEKCLVDFGRR